MRRSWSAATACCSRATKQRVSPSLRAFLAEVVEPQIPEFGGNIFKETAELVLVEFDSGVAAVRCAATLRDAVAQSNQALPDEQRIAMRIGINFGDIIAEDGDIFGDGVNIAARVEALAKPGSVYVSEIVHDQVAGEVDFDFEDLGPQSLKNIARPIRVYRMAGEMAELSEDLLAAGARLAASPPAFDDRRAIAVLPFANFSGDPEQEFFADGITEDIISMLAGWRAFPVIARASTFTYKGKTVDIKKVGEELGVRYVLEGSVRKSGRRVRVTAQLIQADTEPSHNGREVRSRPHRFVRVTGRNHPRDCRRDRARTPQIRTRPHR